MSASVIKEENVVVFKAEPYTLKTTYSTDDLFSLQEADKQYTNYNHWL